MSPTRPERPSWCRIEAEWSVTDAVAPVSGVCVDVLDGNIAAAGTKPWADLHVERFASLGLSGLIERWNEVAPTVEELGPAFPPQAAASSSSTPRRTNKTSGAPPIVPGPVTRPACSSGWPSWAPASTST